MEVGKLTVDVRKGSGKNESGRLRKTGLVPGICYGKGNEPLAIALDPKSLKRALDPEKRQNTVIRMTVNGHGSELTVMLKDYQVDSIRSEVQHVDFVTIDVNKDVRVEIPVILVGRAVGVVDGGQLHAVYRKLPVLCKPEYIPVKIEADVTALKIGDTIHVRDLKLPLGVKAALPPTETIASVVAPRAEKTAEQEAAEAAAVEAAAAEAAAPAAGAKGAEAKGGEAKPAAAKPAAAKPAAEKKEKK